jgi:hypothetical protein
VSDQGGLGQLERTVTLNRNKGDALAARGRQDDAVDAYRTAADRADEALRLLGIDPGETADPANLIDLEHAGDAAEWFGVRAGLLRRIGELGQPEALEHALQSCRRGAEIETKYELSSTYNRANAVKLALIMGKTTVSDERGDLAALRDVLDRRLASDVQAADDAWLWADLGDVALLLGDERKALSAYTTFAEKARTKSPASTLKVLRALVGALKTHHDPDASAVEAAADRVEALLPVR